MKKVNVSNVNVSNVSNVIWNNVNALSVTLSWDNVKWKAVLVKVEDKVYIDATHFRVRDQELQHLSRRNYKRIGNELWFDVNSLDSLLDTDFSETFCSEWLESHLSEIQNFSWKTETKPNNDKQLSVVKFYDDELLLVDVDGQPFVVMKRIVENLGLDWATQQQKIQDDSRYDKLHRLIPMQLPNDIQRRKIFVLALEMLPTWLMSVNANRIAAHLKDKIIRYQRECSQALWLYWSQGSAVKTDNGPVTLQETPVSNVENNQLIKLVLEVQRQANADRKEMQTQLLDMQQSILQMQQRQEENNAKIHGLVLSIQEKTSQDYKQLCELLSRSLNPNKVYMSVAAFRQEYSLNMSDYDAQQIGRQATSVCEKQNLMIKREVKREGDRRVASTSYPLSVLLQVANIH